jgi:hypothetical protein
MTIIVAKEQNNQTIDRLSYSDFLETVRRYQLLIEKKTDNIFEA